MISLHYTSHTKVYNTIYTACNIVEAIYSFTYGSKSVRSSNWRPLIVPRRLLLMLVSTPLKTLLFGFLVSGGIKMYGPLTFNSAVAYCTAFRAY